MAQLKSLFKKQKDDPAFLSGQEKRRLSLLKSLSRAIKEVQLLHATQGAGCEVGDCRATERLCARFEEVLRHGLRASWFGQSSFWPVVLKISRKQAIKYINSLQYAQTDNGRCRAWIRMAVNECSLESYVNVLCQDGSLLGNVESYVNVLCQDGSLLGQYYELFSFVRDEEMVSALKQLLTGLSEIHLNITVDTASLEFEAAPEALQPALRLRLPQNTELVKITAPQRRRRRRKRTATSLNWGEGEGQVGSVSCSGSSDWSSSEEEEEEEEGEGEMGSIQEEAEASLEGPHTAEEEGATDGSGSPSWSPGLTDTGVLVDSARELEGTEDTVPPSEDASSPIADFHSLDDAVDGPRHSLSPSPPRELAPGRSSSSPTVVDSSLVSDTRTDSGTVENSHSPPPTLGDSLQDGSTVDSALEDSQTVGPPIDTQVEHNSSMEDSEKPDWNPFGPQMEDPTVLPDVLRVASPTQPFTAHWLALQSQFAQSTNPFDDAQFSQSTNPFNNIPPDVNPFDNIPSNVNPFDDTLSDTSHSLPDGCSPLPTPTPPLSPTLDRRGEPSKDSSLHLATSEGEESSTAGSLDWSIMLEEALSRPHFLEESLHPYEDHFSPELSMEGLQLVIAQLKRELSSLPEQRETQDLRKKIIQLQIKLQDMKEESSEVVDSVQEVSGHKFVHQPRQSRKMEAVVCEGCGKNIWGLIRHWYLCKKCSSASHIACLPQVTRLCVGSKVEGSYVLEVCPERGLTHQQFRCARCNRAFVNQPVETRLCDYTGLYYCSSCHHNDQAVIPARVLHNWDFTRRKVCCRCSDLLQRLAHKPLMRIEEGNKLLYTYVQDLVTVEALRQDILLMKQYFVQCRTALDSHLLQKLDRFPHFKDEAKLFSLTDLVALHEGRLVPELQEIHRTFTQHIQVDCSTCSGKGFFCEVCKSEEVLYPFDRHVCVCGTCSSVFHRACFSEMAPCPRCVRLRRRRSSSSFT